MFIQEQSPIIINLKKRLYIFNLSLFLLLATNGLAQLNPLAVTVSMHGDVKVALPLPFMYLYQSSTVSFDQSTVPIKVHTYRYRSENDSVLEAITSPNLRYENVMLYTFHSPKPVEFIFDLNQFKLDSVGSRKKVNLTNFEHAIHGHAYDRPQSEYKLVLKYKKNQLLQKIKLERKMITKEKVTKSQSRYKLSYNKYGLKCVKNEATTTKYAYDTKGNVTSIISYTGHFKNIYKTYLCIDSLERYFDTDAPSYKIRENYSSYDTEIHDMVFYEYNQNKVVKMVAYSSSGEITKTKVVYDSLGQVAEFREFDFMGGIEMKFKYDKDGKLMQRNEKRISNCFERGCSQPEILETYTYNDKKAVSEITFYYGDLYFNRAKGKFKIERKSIYKYN
jgi:hypothetical protein